MAINMQNLIVDDETQPGDTARTRWKFINRGSKFWYIGEEDLSADRIMWANE